MKTPKRKVKAKPVKAWAHVNEDTNKVTWICEPGTTKAFANWSCGLDERLTRIEIKET